MSAFPEAAFALKISENTFIKFFMKSLFKQSDHKTILISIFKKITSADNTERKILIA